VKLRDKRGQKLAGGDRVMSTYRASWTGVIICQAESPENCVWVRVTHDRRGKPVRKPRSLHWVRKLSAGWLVRLPS